MDQLLKGARTEGDRLAAFEVFAAEARAELADASGQMAALRQQGKVKTATYRQLFAARATLREIDRRLAEHGL